MFKHNVIPVKGPIIFFFSGGRHGDHQSSYEKVSM